MGNVLKARVINGRFKDQIVRVSNVSINDSGKKFAACILSDGSRANILADDLEVLKDTPEMQPRKNFAKTASMPFISGSTGSRTMTQTKNMAKPRQEVRAPVSPDKVTLAKCEVCGQEYNLEERKGMPGKITECEHCALETETKMEGKMIFSHKTGATIEIKKDGELKHEAPIYDPKNKNVD